MTAWTPRVAIDAGVQAIYQDFSLFGNLTVAENLALSALLREGARTVTRRRVLDIAGKAIEALRVDLDLQQDVATLPVAGKQLVAIARALMSSPKILIMDEPTTALTEQEIAILFRIVRDIRAQGVGVARLVGGTCQGCHLSIPSTEVERIRKSPEGSVQFCDNCGCILVP